MLRKFIVFVSVLLCSSPAYATIDWEEGFEYANDAAFGAVWEYSCLGNPGISTLRPYGGTKSARQSFTGHVGVNPGAGGCFMTRNLGGRSDTVYTRWYMYMENFTVDYVGTKITRHEDSVPGLPGVWWTLPFGNVNLAAAVEGIILDSGAQDTQHVYGGVVPQNQWVCIETFLSMGTPGVDNGITRAWINGVQILDKTNQRMRSATLNQTNGPNTKFGRIKLYTQHGVGVYYIDNYAVSRDARIGCSGTPPPVDTTAPTAPSSLVAQ